MLRLAKVRHGGQAYYLEPTGWPELGTGSEPPGQWKGSAIPTMGLAQGGNVDGNHLASILDGRSADGTSLLSETSRRRIRVVAFDLTFCAPKSVSLLGALGDDDVAAQVIAGHEAAVARSLAHLESDVISVRRRAGGEDLSLPVDGLAGASFVHRTSRSLDPHLHTHMLVANVARGSDGAFSALDARGLYADAPVTSRLYQAELRNQLTRRLGVEWGQIDRGRADIVGIGPEVRHEFSTRSAAIASHLASRGLGGARARQMASLVTRPERATGVRVEQLRGWWEERARSVGFGPHQIDAALDHGHDTGIARASEGNPETTMTPRWLTDLLGTEPSAPAGRRLWNDAADAVKAYRARWSVDDPVRGLGNRSEAAAAGGGRLPVRQVAERSEVERVVAIAQLRLGNVRLGNVRQPDLALPGRHPRATPQRDVSDDSGLGLAR